jgi:hypothetical protein
MSKSPFETISADCPPVQRLSNIKFAATLEPRSRKDLNEERLSFSCSSWYVLEAYLKVEGSSLMAKYFTRM